MALMIQSPLYGRGQRQTVVAERERVKEETNKKQTTVKMKLIYHKTKNEYKNE
jgi:hypothetical protein